VDKRKIHWVNWKKTCKAKSKGGMGFKNLRVFNEALLAKQGWGLITNPQSLVARMFKAKYYPRCNFLKGKKDSKLELLLAKHSKSQLDPKERLCVANRRW
jgi:hypothetical protein